jgi:hypothetical protein
MPQTLRKVAHLFAGKSTALIGQSPYPIANPTAFQRHNACWIMVQQLTHNHQIINNGGSYYGEQKWRGLGSDEGLPRNDELRPFPSI